MPKAEDYLYPNQMIVEIGDYYGLRTEIDRLRAEKAEMKKRLRYVAMHCCNGGIAAYANAVANETETEPYEPPPYDRGKDKIP